MIPKDTVDKIFDNALIEEVVGDFVHLKKSGSNYKGLSPFTTEKTPSFYVSPAKGIYKCFSSGKGGNAVNFLMEHEKLTYPEALRWLAEKYQIEIIEEQVSDEQKEALNERESLSIVTAFAQKTFHDQLFNDQEGRAIGLSYFKERGFREDIIKKFGLGYCIDKWDVFTQEALKNGHSLEFLQKAGLSKDRNGSPFDFFRGRVMFPILNVSGKPIGFGGRTLKSDKKIAKYFNSPESPLYDKSRALYGIYHGKTAMVQQDECYLVEGYTDVIGMHQSGVENVVASSGTSLTEGQIKLIQRYTKNITILFDGDKAGIKASFRGIDMILKAGLNVRVVLFPEGEDPDSFSKSKSSTEVQEYLEEAKKDFVIFKTDVLSKETGGDPIKRAEMIRDIVSSVALIPDAIKRSVYLKECADLMEMEEQTLLTELNKLIKGQIKKATGQEYQPEPEVRQMQPQHKDSKISTKAQEWDLMRIMLNYGSHLIDVPTEMVFEVVEEDMPKTTTMSVAEFAVNEIRHDEIVFEDLALQDIYSLYCEYLERGEFPQSKVFVNVEDPHLSSLAADLLSDPHSLSPNWEAAHKIYPVTEEMLIGKAIEASVYHLKLRKVLKRMQEIDEELKKTTEEEAVKKLLTEKMSLNAAKTAIAAQFESAIIA